MTRTGLEVANVRRGFQAKQAPLRFEKREMWAAALLDRNSRVNPSIKVFKFPPIGFDYVSEYLLIDPEPTP